MKNLTSFKTIKQFGPFRNFDWKTVKGKDGQLLHFRPLNFIFGRNYSGKTTLSKILQAFERETLPEHYDHAAFELEFEGGTVLNATQVAHAPAPIRVFNRDFVSDNLAFLRDTRKASENIMPFAILGAGSRDLEEKIEAKLVELGVSNGDQSTGLMLKRDRAAQALSDKQTALKGVINELDRAKKDIATGKDRGIKYDPDYGQPNYTVRLLEKDIESVQAKGYTDIDDATDAKLKQLIAEQPKPPIDRGNFPNFNLTDLMSRVRELLTRNIVPGKKILELLNDHAKENWAREGYKLHETNHSICAFCGQPIADERWVALRQHFSGEAETLRSAILELIGWLEKEKGHPCPQTSTLPFYSSFMDEAQKLDPDLANAFTSYRAVCDALISLLREREQSIVSPVDKPLPNDPSPELLDVYYRFVNLVEENNSFTKNLRDVQQKARETIRLHRVASAIRERGLDTLSSRIETLTKERDELDAKHREAEAAVQRVQNEIDELLRQRSNASAAAELVNKYMSWLGTRENSLSLTAVEIEEDGVRSKVFRVMRGDNQAFNLSEGECNLIAFCYFLATLSGPELQNDKPIIWIDDPISSLDSNHVYFVYAMIRGVILNGKRYAQLFVSTHNLDFFRYLRHVADWTVKSNGDEQKIPCEWFFVHNTGDGPTISPLPSYLKNYITEFSYLFSRIYDAAESAPTAADYEKLTYGFGNAARRFLEIYLYFKFPNDRADARTEHTTRMVSVFGDHVRAFMVDRVINEMSHEPGAFERTMRPVDSEEIHEVAQEILKRIRAKDRTQYDELLRGIGKEDPFED